MTMSELNELLGKLYQEEVKPDSNSKGYSKLCLYIKKVLEKVGDTHPCFRLSKHQFVAGPGTNIYALPTKEIERFVIFNIKGSVKDIQESAGFAKFQVDSSVRVEWGDCTNKDGYLEPRKVILKYKKCIHSALKEIEPDFAGDMLIHTKVKGGVTTALTITGSYCPIMLTMNPSSYTKIKCELNLLIGCEGLPALKSASWLNGSPLQIDIWPTFEMVEVIRNIIGCELVVTNMHADDNSNCKNPSDLHMMYSVSRAESFILQHFPVWLTQTKLMAILKAILKLFDIPKCFNQILPLTSYHLKTIMLYEAHDYPDPDSWQQDKLGERYVSALKRLLQSIEENYLPHFFFPKVNTFQWRDDAMRSKIAEIVKNPQTLLEKLISAEESNNTLRFNAVLEKFYQDKAKGWNLEGYDELWLYIETVLAEVENEDIRFRSSKVELVGSSAAGVSAILTKEMDRLVIFNIKGDITDIPGCPGYAQFQVASSVRKDWNDCINEEGYLEPRKIATKFKACFDRAVSTIKSNYPAGLPEFKQKLTDIEVEGGDSVAITVSGSYGQSSLILGKVKCDLVLLIGFQRMPDTKLAQWLNTSSSQKNQWPTLETVENIQKNVGFGLVAKNVHAEDSNICNTASDLHLMWRYSVSRAETCLLRHCSDDLIHKKLLVILKAVRLFEIPEGSDPTPPLTSYHMKTILLHEAHVYPDPDSWKQDKLGERYLSAMNRLLTSIEKNDLPHFFFPSVNLFHGEQYRMTSTIKKMLSNPEEYLQLLTIEEGRQPIESRFESLMW